MLFGNFLTTFRTFKRKGGATERRKKNMSTYPITTKKAECVCSLSRKFFSLSGTKETLNVGACKTCFIFDLNYCRFYQNVIEMK